MEDRAMDDRTDRPGIGSGREDDGIFSSSRTTLNEASITISTPRGGFVGRKFAVTGTAFVSMKTVEFIKVGGTGRTISTIVSVTESLVRSKKLQVVVQIGDTEHKPPLTMDGKRLRWSHSVENAQPGPLRITARLTGQVTETQEKSGAGPPQHRSTTRRFEDTDGAALTVDFDGPDVNISSHTVSIGPPWHVVLEGTAVDQAGLQPLQWQLGQSASGMAENVSGDWSRWRAVVSLPDRSVSHTIIVSATDRAGNNGADNIAIPADTTPPILALTQPPLNPHRVLWQEGGITVPVLGIAVDTESKLARVTWRLDDGAETEAEQTSDNWSTWRLTAAIESPGAHTVAVSATDMSGNTSDPLVLEVRVQVQSVG
jgi:hypothetical protein